MKNKNTNHQLQFVIFSVDFNQIFNYQNFE